jgi:DNA-binding LytR/AlgR family response regulator
MKEAIKQMNDPLIVFSHRSFIINLRKIQKVSSQSGISTITLKNTETPIPLSSTHKKVIGLKLKDIR